MDSDHYRLLITPELLAAESGVRWFREPTPYLYLRECLLMEEDHQREVRPLLELVEGCEIVGITECRYRYSGPRRCWYLRHGSRLDGLDLPPVEDGEGYIVKPTIAAGEYSEPGFLERELTAEDYATATVAKLAALDFWARHEREQTRLREVNRAQHARKLAEVKARQSTYKADADADD